MTEFYEEYLGSLEKRGSKLGLGRTERLVKRLGNPQKNFKSILVGGTNGKGSVCSMLSSILTQAGFKTGLYTSPHLVDARERIRINEKDIEVTELNEVLGTLKRIADGMDDEPTYFEVLTASALKCFSDRCVDWTVLEVGLGGRLDSVNVVNPELAIVTNVELEHTRELGDTIEKIANEKAAIAKGRTLVTAEKRKSVLEIFRKNANEVLNIKAPERKDSNLNGQSFEYDDNVWWIPFLGVHQVLNAAVAIETAQCIGIKNESIKDGLRNARWPGRFQIIRKRPLVILDAAHNPAGAKALKETLEQYVVYDRLILVLGIMKDKDLQGIIESLPKADEYVITTIPNLKRAADPKAILKYTKRGRIIRNGPKNALDYALSIAKNEDAILVTGSLHTVAGILKEAR